MKLPAVLGVLLLLPPAAAAERPPTRADLIQARIASLTATRGPSGVRVSYRVVGGLDQETLERIRSGIAVTFRHRVELRVRRAIPLFPEKTVGRTLVKTTVRYDSLTRQYEVIRTVRGKGWPEKGRASPRSTEVHRTDSVDEMERWMTVLRDVPLPSPPSRTSPARLRVAVRSELAPRFLLFLIPSSYAASAERPLER